MKEIEDGGILRETENTCSISLIREKLLRKDRNRTRLLDERIEPFGEYLMRSPHESARVARRKCR